jgi:hypothetical protein
MIEMGDKIMCKGHHERYVSRYRDRDVKLCGEFVQYDGDMII